MCQKLQKMIESRQSYSKERRVQFFGPPCIYIYRPIYINSLPIILVNKG